MMYKQISLKLPKGILERLDMESKSRYKKRSEVIREAILSYIGIHKELHTEEKLKDKKNFQRKFLCPISDFVADSDDELLKKWMKNTVDIGKTHAAKEHDITF